MTTQGTPNHSRLVSLVDLDALLAARSLAPVPVKLGGATYQVRTDLTGAETQRFINLMTLGFDAQAFTILVGTKAERAALDKAFAEHLRAGDKKVELPAGKAAARLDAYLDTLPRMHQALVSSRIMHASKALAQHSKSEQDIYAEYGYEIDDGDRESAEQGESSAS